MKDNNIKILFKDNTGVNDIVQYLLDNTNNIAQLAVVFTTKTTHIEFAYSDIQTLKLVGMLEYLKNKLLNRKVVDK